MPARLHFPTVDDTRCQVCTPCEAAAVCKVRAIVRIDPGEPPMVNPERGYDCRLCLPYLGVDRYGLIYMNELMERMRADTIIVSIMHANMKLVLSSR